MTREGERTVTKIVTGFLTGNLLSDETGVDVDASADAYARELREALERAYPGAVVEVPFQRKASGALPRPFTTRVCFSDGDAAEAGDDDPDVLNVWGIAAGVWETFAWVVGLSEEG